MNLKNFQTNSFRFLFKNQNNLLMTHLQPGDAAPAFSGIDQHGNTRTLSDFQGKKVILYFYPKDDTPGCTAEACDFNNNLESLKKDGFEVIGVSADNQKKHEKFANKYGLSFTLLADTERTIIDAYGVWGRKKFMGREYDGIYRETFVIDEAGKILHVITDVKTKQAVEQIRALFS
jgi:peroxiredoxin Q/BCP